MFFVYVIKQVPAGRFYIGYTADLNRRIAEHRKDGGFDLVYYEAYASPEQARERERKLKQYGGAWRSLKQRL